MWNIHKTIDFCYGHRTYTQRLNGEFANDLKMACRHFHGHEGSVKVHLQGDKLNETGMVTDFRHLEWLKRFIDAHIDHQFIMDVNDPLFRMFVMTPYFTLLGEEEKLAETTPFAFVEQYCQPIFVPETDYVIGFELKVEQFRGTDAEFTPEFESAEGITVVDFVPTSENLSRWLAEFTQAKMSRLDVKVSRVEWYETPRSCSVYSQ